MHCAAAAAVCDLRFVVCGSWSAVRRFWITANSETSEPPPPSRRPSARAAGVGAGASWGVGSEYYSSARGVGSEDSSDGSAGKTLREPLLPAAAASRSPVAAVAAEASSSPVAALRSPLARLAAAMGSGESHED